MVYIDEDAFAVKHNYANWTAYSADNPNNPTLANVTEWIEEASEIINENIGSHNEDITDTRFLSRVQKLCLRMVIRMEQIDLGQGIQGRIPLFSPNDFLIERERDYLQFVVGFGLGYKKVGGVSD